MINSSDILNARILIVDDQEVNVLLLERMLRGAGYLSITSTMDPGGVCELHRNNPFDLILLDLQMPVMDGFQVMEALKEIEPDGYSPVLVITAQPDHKLRALRAGAKDFVSKPFDLAEVLARVHNMLEVRLLHAESKRYGKALEQKIREVEVHQIKLEISRARYLDLYDFAPVAYFSVGKDGMILQANLTAAVLLGVGRADLIGHPFTQFIFPEDQEVYERHQKALVESDESRTDELRMLRGESGPFWAQLKAVVAKVDDGSTGCRVVVTDIDERKKAGQERDRLVDELQKALENVKLLSGLLPICMWCKKIRDDQGYWNAIEQYLGQHSEAEFSHGICPDCKSKYYGDLFHEEK